MKLLIDLNEFELYKQNKMFLELLLTDKTTNKYIKLCTSSYSECSENDYLTPDIVNTNFIKPRVSKTKEIQSKRSKDKAEVFTPSWICNSQNNLIDNNWFGYSNAFNTEKEKSWVTNYNKIDFKDKSWKDYILEKQLEVACGEAPYLVSRYDVVSGNEIDILDRIGLLDRKLRVLNENASDNEWLEWCFNAFKSVYGYDYQGDNVLLARENLLLTFIDYYSHKFFEYPKDELILKVIDIISWNIWQMDGTKFVIPNSCINEEITETDLFGVKTSKIIKCDGCLENDYYSHNGVYCRIMDWESNKDIEFIRLVNNHDIHSPHQKSRATRRIDSR